MAQYVTAGSRSTTQIQPIQTLGSTAQSLQYMVAPAEAYGGDKVSNQLSKTCCQTQICSDSMCPFWLRHCDRC
jgi:hypothetical protein